MPSPSRPLKASLIPWKMLRRMCPWQVFLKPSCLLALVFSIGLCLQLLLLWNNHLFSTISGTPSEIIHVKSRAASHDPAPEANTAPLLLNLKPDVDDRPELLKDVLSRVHNLPPRYSDEGLRREANNCTRYPALVDLDFNNVYWQVQVLDQVTFYLYSAFFDNRTLTKPGASVRILSMAARIKLNITSHCQFWFAGEEAPVVTRVIEYRYVWIRTFGNFKNGILQPYLMQCVIPPSHAHRIPDSVSVVGKRCDKPRNNLRVVYNPPPTPGRKKDFAVCVKGLDIDNDISVNIVEWLELMFLLGADKVFLYDYGSHPNITKVLRHYAARGKVDLKRLTLPGVQPNVRGLTRRYHKAKVTNKRQNEIIPYNDCLYRNIARYKFIVLVDIDEVIMPRNASGWRELMQQVAPKAMSGEAHPRSSYYVRNVYFLDSMQEKQGWDRNVPRFMHMLQHVHRAINYTAPTSYIKAFHDTERVQTLHNHFPFSCLMNNCSSISIPTTKAHLQHYRKDCVNDLRKLCAYYRNHTVMDQAILRYKEPLKRATLKTLRDLKFV